MLLDSVQSFEQRIEVLFHGILGRGEAGLVDAVVDEVVGPGVRLFNGLLEIFWEKNNVLVLLRQQVIKL